MSDTIQFVDYYQTPLNAGTYELTTTLTAPDALQGAGLDITNSNPVKIKLQVAGPRFLLPPSEIHSVFPPENGEGDYNNVLPHVVLNRRTLPWERLVDKKNADKVRDDELEKIPFLALLVFSEDEEINGDVTPLKTSTLADLLLDDSAPYALEPGDKLTDKVNVIDVKPSLLEQIIPTGEELSLLAHGRERHQGDAAHQRAVVIANRLPAPPMFGIIPDVQNADNEGVLVQGVQGGSVGEKAGIQTGDLIVKVENIIVKSLNDITTAITTYQPTKNDQSDRKIVFTVLRSKKRENLPAVVVPDSDTKRRNIAHLVMLENRYDASTGTFKFTTGTSDAIRLICLKSWQFNCSADKPTLKDRLLKKQKFTFELFSVPKNGNDSFETLRKMSYAVLPYHLRWGDRTHTLYHGPLVASSADNGLHTEVPSSADGLVRLIENHRIFDVSLAAAWQLGQMLMLRDQSVAMEYFTWRRRDAQLRARETDWESDGHLHTSDNVHAELTTMPDTVSNWFKERLELRGLPFEYLVPDPRMLPQHSLRIFKIHEGWMDCLLSGALAVGRAGEADRLLEAEYRSTVYPEDAHNRTGFLLRSPAVDEHPDLEVTAEGTTKKVRLERIGPGLLLGLYDGTFSKLQFSLPPIGLYFGFKEEGDNFVKDIKNDADGKETGDKVTATFRGERVVEIGDLRDAIGKDLPSGRFAFQMCEGTEMVEFKVKALDSS